MPETTITTTQAPLLTEREQVRERLKSSVNTLTQEVNLQAKMQTEPLKIIGGASAVGAVVGLLLGSQVKRSKKIYVDAGSPIKHQKSLIKAQNAQKNSVGGALLVTLGTLAVKTLTDKVIAPKIEEFAAGLIAKAGAPKAASSDKIKPTAPKAIAAGPVSSASVSQPSLSTSLSTNLSKDKEPVTSSTPIGRHSGAATSVSTGGINSFLKVEISEAEKANPNFKPKE